MDPTPAPSGLSAAQAADRLRRDGPNILPLQRPPSPVLMLLRQMTHFFALMLWAAAGLALIAGLPQLSIAIAVIIVVNGAFAFAQEYHASVTAEHLVRLLPAQATVIRNGVRHEVPAADLVAGDVVLLEAGDRICADGVLSAADGLAVDESLLTGESAPVDRHAGEEVYAGTFATQGDATMAVRATGGRTRLASIGAMSRARHRPPSRRCSWSSSACRGCSTSWAAPGRRRWAGAGCHRGCGGALGRYRVQGRATAHPLPLPGAHGAHRGCRCLRDAAVGRRRRGRCSRRRHRCGAAPLPTPGPRGRPSPVDTGPERAAYTGPEAGIPVERVVAVAVGGLAYLRV